MGANFSKPLVANKVTHLICYKFEGKYVSLQLQHVAGCNSSLIISCLCSMHNPREGEWGFQMVLHKFPLCS